MTGCSCTWTTIAEMPLRVPVMTSRAADCPLHGDDTDWWARTQAHARTLTEGTQR